MHHVFELATDATVLHGKELARTVFDLKQDGELFGLERIEKCEHP